MAINDFGAKIGGAKKDLWKLRGLQISDLSEMNNAERLKLITKDNVWQKPDYAALVADGLPVRVAWFIKTVRDSLPAKPVLGYGDDAPDILDRKQQAYIGFVGDIRDAVLACKTDADILRVANRQWLVDNGFIEAGRGYYVKPTALGDSAINNKFLKAFCLSATDLRRFDREIQKKQFLFTDEQKALAKYEFFKYENVEWEQDYQKRTVMKVPVAGGKMYLYPQGELVDKNSWKDGTHFVMDGRRNVVARNLESLEAAKQFVLDREAGKESAEKSKKKGKTRFTPKQLQHIHRTVKDDYRHGKDIGGEEYMDVFGFKGGEFGNWMSEKDRQASLNLGYEALLDLAKALQIEPADISLGNSLSIAFGARGSGSALAHYEPLREVINLTKMRGAGSLAHEWAHALDDVLGKQLGLPGFMSENMRAKGLDKIPESFYKLIDALQYKLVAPEVAQEARQKDIDDYTNRLKRYIDSTFFPVRSMTEEQIAKKDMLVQRYLDGAAHVDKAVSLEVVLTGNGNPEIDALSNFRKELTGRGLQKESRIHLGQWQNNLSSKIKSLLEPSKVKTEFYENSERFDKEHTKTDNGYWASKVEMFARAFACYVTDKLAGQSDYLSGHSELAVSMAVKNGEAVVIKAIPVGTERAHINECFDVMIQELKEKGLLHHREDFTEFVERYAPVILEENDSARAARMAEIESFDPNRTEQLSFESLLENAFERAGSGVSKGSQEKGIEK